MNDAQSHGPLGQAVVYADRYDPRLLFPIARAENRERLGIGAHLPFDGVDIWNAYELSWLDARGKPQIALAEFRIPAHSPNIIESKSFKLYLMSFNRERISDHRALHARLARDLSAASGADVSATLVAPAQFHAIERAEPAGVSIDDEPIEIDDYGPPNASHLKLAADACMIEQTLVSNLLKSNCPVTGQPDWASVEIAYRGAAIDPAGLLRYLVSFRDHAEFHEHCVERIFVDLMQRCAPAQLRVNARYTRRGGLDINPWRASAPGAAGNARTARQ